MYEPVILRNVGIENSWDIDVYTERGGYRQAPKALSEYDPGGLIDLVKQSGLRGRGGAGFPTGIKWGFVPKDPTLTKYLVINADESEPGTFSNRAILENDPHQMIEGIIIGAYAIGASTAFIYCRGEFAVGAQRTSAALEQAKERGFIGKGVFGTDYNLDIYLVRGAGAYICGEETALLESLEGYRPMPRTRPPFPAVEGLYSKPTVINNVETLCNLPHILERGVEWYTSIGRPPRNTGPKVFCVSGLVRDPGNKELPLGVPLRELIYEHSGGMIDDRPVKAVIPGGASAQMIGADQLDINMDFDSLAAVGSMLGSGGVIVMNDQVCIPHSVLRIAEFFSHESCGKCTPCREGTSWLVQILRRICNGQGRFEDLDLLLDLCGKIAGGRTVCALGDASANPVLSGIKLFREEYEHHIKHGTCPTQN